MKYIRTKDGTIELNREEIEREIIKQADTIEELCDKYIIKGTDLYTNMSAYTTLNYCPNKEQLIIHPTHKIEIYGAIWTEWGLKYVAKMNEKGELELL